MREAWQAFGAYLRAIYDPSVNQKDVLADLEKWKTANPRPAMYLQLIGLAIGVVLIVALVLLVATITSGLKAAYGVKT